MIDEMVLIHVNYIYCLGIYVVWTKTADKMELGETYTKHLSRLVVETV